MRILFHKKDGDIVREAIHNLYDYAVEVFGEDLTGQMISADELKRAKLSRDSAKEH